MKRELQIPPVLSLILFFTFFFVCISQGNINLSQSESIKITYIANEGFLLESAGKKVLIDALFTDGLGYYMLPSPHIRSQIINGDSLFNNADLFLITHNHTDHFNALLINNYLSNNIVRYVLCSNITGNNLKTQQGYNNYKDRIIVATPPLFSSIDTTVHNLKIKVLRLRHDGSSGDDENIGYVINLNGINIFHAGDNDGYVAEGQTTSGITEYSRIGMDSVKVDVAILNRGFFWEGTAPGIEIIKKYIKPKHIILAHFSVNNLQGEWDSVKKVMKQNESALPDITILQNSMDSKTYYFIETGIRDEYPHSSSYGLFQNYPNPFNPTTVISYRLPASSKVKLEIYNVLGQRINTLLDSFQNAGEHSLVWDATDEKDNPVSSGIYLYRLKTDKMSIQKKMILIR
jgi:L-ascorbate metabolism protein UlaG (beta-lactamase superfamily)